MHARFTTVDIQPGKVNDAIEAYANSTLPVTRDQQGYKGALMLIDRDLSRAISITLWDNEDDMAAGEVSTYYIEQLRKLAQFFAGMPQRDSFEVAVVDMKDNG